MSLEGRPSRNCCCGIGVVRIDSGLSVFFKTFAKHMFSFPHVLFFTFKTFDHVGKIS